MINFRGIPDCGTLSKYDIWRCRCEICKANYSAYQKRRRVATRQRINENPQDFTHGNRTTYLNGCRCDDCKAAAAAYARTYRAAVRKRLADEG